MSETHEGIDLNKLKERELLILVYKKVENLEETSKEQTGKQIQTDIQMAILKTKIQMSSAIIGFVTGLFSSVVVIVIAEIIKK
ncbi:MAG: hypothetical protein JSR11_03660 [Bacteroidetes bacterium]|nr:hypothetical protein [Bacteroidota bacterium]